MQELIHVIIGLLSKHTCVIIPGFGGFVINEKSAVVSSSGDRFFPPRKELIFNPHLSHNDGLLAHALMQEKGISFDEADRMITEKVKAARKELEIHKIFSLGDFGFFSFEASGIIFHAKDIKIENSEAFGLREFYFPALQATAGTTGMEPLRANQPGITPSLSRAIMGGIAATIALFLFCQPLKNEGGMNQASLFPLISSEAIVRNAELIAKEKALQESLKTLDYYLVVEESESEEEAFLIANSIELEEGDSIRVLPVEGKFLITFPLPSGSGKINETMKDFQARYAAFPDAFMLGLQK